MNAGYRVTMNWEDLNIFLAVARHAKLDAAATYLEMDATTISRRLKRLEASLGTTLFERTRRGHLLTVSGESLAARVEKMESVAFDIASESSIENSASGRIRLGAPEGVGSKIIAPALANFYKAHPNIEIDLIALSGFVSVPRREADMSLLLTRPTTGRLKIRRLSDYSLGLYGASTYLSCRDSFGTISDLYNETLVGYVDDLIYSSKLRYFGEVLPGTRPALCSTSINAQLEMVCSGAGLGILPNFMARKDKRLTQLFPQDIQIERTFWLATHEDVADLKRNRLLSDFLYEVLRQLE